jgi:hypothetical protein
LGTLGVLWTGGVYHHQEQMRGLRATALRVDIVRSSIKLEASETNLYHARENQVKIIKMINTWLQWRSLKKNSWVGQAKKKHKKFGRKHIISLEI